MKKFREDFPEFPKNYAAGVEKGGRMRNKTEVMKFLKAGVLKAVNEGAKGAEGNESGKKREVAMSSSSSSSSFSSSRASAKPATKKKTNSSAKIYAYFRKPNDSASNPKFTSSSPFSETEPKKQT